MHNLIIKQNQRTPIWNPVDQCLSCGIPKPRPPIRTDASAIFYRACYIEMYAHAYRCTRARTNLELRIITTLQKY
jgi:hypothetical protein